MRKVLDWKEVESRARTMSPTELRCARRDSSETAELWERAQPAWLNDPDDNAGYYRDEASVYAREMDSRARA